MKISLFSIHKKISLTLLAFAVTGISFGAVFTASNSGNFSSTSTWVGGVVPSISLLADQIIIPSGIAVNLDNNLSINGALASLAVEGGLTTTNSSSLTLNLGTLSGAGTIVLNSVNVNIGSTVSFTGSLTANTLNAATGFSSSAALVVNQTLNLTTGTLSLISGGSLGISNNGTIVVSGGLLAIGLGGSVALTNNYNVSYTTLSSIAGIELNGSGLKNVTINVGAANTVTLSSDLTIAPSSTLSLISGTLALAGNDLTINGVVAAGSGTVASTFSSNINFNTAGGTSGIVTFSGLTPAVNNLTVNVGIGNQAQIGGTLAVVGTVQLNSGTLNINDATITVSGNIAGSGSLSANSSTNLTLSNSTTASSLRFVSGGQTINDLTIALNAVNAPTLLSNLTVTGMLTLSGSSNLILNGNTLTLGANNTIVGLGSFVANSTSSLIINATGGVSSLKIVGTLGNLTINTGGSTPVNLANDLTTAGTLTLQSGALELAGKDLTINGNIATSGSGTIAADSVANITVATTTAPSGALYFSSTANSIGNFVVNIADNGAVNIGSNLIVKDTLRFLNGSLNIGSNALVIDAMGKITGAGSASYIITAAGGYVQQDIVAGAMTSVNYPVGTSTNFAPANIQLNTGSASGQVQVGVVNDVLAQGTTGADLSSSQSLVDATWNVSSNITSNLNLNLEVMWSSAMQVNGFNANTSYIAHYTNGSWDTRTATAATVVGSMFSQKAVGLTSLSPFTVFDNNTTTPINEVTQDVNFAIFPNPTINNLTIQNSTSASEPFSIDIYNVTGQLMSSYKLVDARMDVSVSQFEKGTYFIKIYNSKINSTKLFNKM